MARKVLRFEIGMSGTEHSTHHWVLDCSTHSDHDVRSLVAVLVAGLFQTDEDKELSKRYLKVIGDRSSIQWTSRQIQKVNPDIDSFDIPQPLTEE
ncbi:MULTISPECIES: hypothetical protein [Pseudoalteromonas]|uniref:hypothetical protein n=1 Tax=Pseudoalteromonas TaxID=53246 RepID=UPI0015819CB2|nr:MULTISPECIES: hypothetical protein [Pseudoalteromonas]MDI4652543.1 hypothetical protein [Pseudoalteromonas shioyasakiensis]NUJ38749.1 hypothetical protein [Pseudoalteromonas sp. 0303]